MRATLEKYATEAEWLEARATGIGASEAPAVMGLSRWKSPLELWAGKRGLMAPVTKTAAMDWGHRHEPTVAAWYAESTGDEVIDHGDYAIARHPDLPFMYATLDREVRRPGRREPGVLEIKTTRFERDWADGVPREVWVQVQHQLCVSGAAWAVVAVLIGGNDPRHYEVDRDDAFIAELVSACTAFWRMVQDGEQPTDVGPGDADVIKTLYPEPTPGANVPLPLEAAAWDGELLAVNDELKAGKERKAELENRIKLAIGHAEAGTCSDGTTYTFKSQARKGSLQVESQYAEDLRAAGVAFTEKQASTYRVLRRKGAK